MRKNSIAIVDDKDLMSQWHEKLNKEHNILPETISIGSHKKAFWYCKKHDLVYSQVIRARKRGQTGCEMCKQEQLKSINRERYIKGKKVLAETHPELVKEWVKCDNNKFTPYTCLPNSNIEVTWKCPDCGGEYNALISNRTRMKSGCPYCAGQKVLSGYNDLKTKNPLLALEWSNKNKITPEEVTEKSNKKVYWTCKLGHDDYLSSVKQRSNGQGCPVCALSSQTSFPEQAIYYYVKQLFPDTSNRYNVEGLEIDIFIPCLKIGIEYNGVYYHKNKKEYDENKKKLLKDKNIRLITVSETNIKNTNLTSKNKPDTFFIYWNYNMNTLSVLINSLLNEISTNHSIIVDCEKDRIGIYEQYINSIQDNSFVKNNPELIKEWDYEKNGKIKPEFVSFGSQKKYFWKCPKCNYSYQAPPRDRIRGSGCPCCSGRVVVKGVNDLKTKCPEIANEWCYEKNNGLKPEDFSFGARESVWWECSNGHIWKKSINGRTNKKHGCPYCSGRNAIKGVNDLATTHPELVKEWDYKKNNFAPQDIKSGSNRMAWWICKEGHSYKKMIAQRTKQKVGCPYCSGRKVLVGFNDLKTKNPKLAEEWDYEKNINEKPEQFVCGTHHKVWWKCPKCSHRWKVSIANRNEHYGCPKCHHKYWE